MNRNSAASFLAVITAAAIPIAVVSTAHATATITSLGSGTPGAVTNENAGTYKIGATGIGVAGAGQWDLTGTTLTPSNFAGKSGNGMSADGLYLIGTIDNNGSITGNAANPVSPAFSIPTTFTTVALPATNAIAARYNVATSTWQGLPGIPNDAYSQSYGCFGSGDSGNVHTPHGISATGRFIVGQGYISAHNTAGTQVTATGNFRFRGWIFDADANGGAGAMRLLPTPFRTTSNTQRRRDGTAWAVSADGTVVLGAQEHNLSTSPTSLDPDGGRPVVWRWDGSDYVMSYLPNGVNGSGFPRPYSMSAGTMHMNAAGTIIVGTAISDLGATFIGKWVWNAGTSSWDPPIEIGSNLATPASWLPLSVTTCGVPPTLLATGLTEDGNTIIGMANYSTCGSFMRGGWIWHDTDNLIKDWYDYQLDVGTPGILEYYGPIDDGDFNPVTGLVKLGNPTGISPDGNAIVGFQGGNQIIVEATPWVLINTNGPACIASQTTLHPVAAETFSNCDSFILSSRSAGTLPLAYQWYKNNVALSDGPTGTGSTISGANEIQLRITSPNPTDEGNYHCEAAGPCGTPSVSTTAVATVAVPPTSNDLCANAITIGEGTNVFSWAPCGAYFSEGGPSDCQPDIFADVWFSYVPSATTDVRIETCGANFDTIIDIFNECNGFILACNDNYTAGPSAGCSSSRSRINSFPVIQGVPVLIRVSAKSGFLSTSASGNISIFAAPVPAPNDDCFSPTAAVLGANPLDTTEATNDLIVTCHSAASRDVWFSYTPTTPGLLSAITCPGTTWNTVLSIHDGPCGFELACNDNIPSPAPAGCTTSQSRISNLATLANVTYYIRVGGNSTSAFGPGTLLLSYNPLGDLNCSGTVDGADISHFAQALLDPTAYNADHDGSPFAACSLSLADINQDTLVDIDDVPGFVNLLINP